MSEEFSRRVDVRIIKDEPKTRAEYMYHVREGALSFQFESEFNDLYQKYLDHFQAYRFHAKAANFEIVSHGENYLHEADCINAIELLFGDDTTMYWAREYGEDRGLNLLRYGVTDRNAQAAGE